jgi:hypothetical protein
VWGVHDRDGLLRDAVRDTMRGEPSGSDIRRRFERQLQEARCAAL